MPARKTTTSSRKTSPPRARRRRGRNGQRTLAVDVGGTGVKASVLDAEGNMLHDRVRIRTPQRLTPRRLVEIVAQLAAKLPPFDRVSVGFPGVVIGGVVRTAHNLGTERFKGFDLDAALTKRLRRPARVANDADVQGLAAVSRRGVEMVITLGTGFGSAILADGRLAPHLELAHHCFHGGKTYEERLGEEALDRMGKKRWLREVDRAIETLRDLVHFDRLYIGGGNARLLDRDALPEDVVIVDNIAGVVGGVRLWDDAPKPRVAKRAGKRPKPKD